MAHFLWNSGLFEMTQPNSNGEMPRPSNNNNKMTQPSNNDETPRSSNNNSNNEATEPGNETTEPSNNNNNNEMTEPSNNNSETTEPSNNNETTDDELTEPKNPSTILSIPGEYKRGLQCLQNTCVAATELRERLQFC